MSSAHTFMQRTAILGEVYLGLSPIFVLIGATAMTASVALIGGLALAHWNDAAMPA